MMCAYQDRARSPRVSQHLMPARRYSLSSISSSSCTFEKAFAIFSAVPGSEPSMVTSTPLASIRIGGGAARVARHPAIATPRLAMLNPDETTKLISPISAAILPSPDRASTTLISAFVRMSRSSTSQSWTACRASRLFSPRMLILMFTHRSLLIHCLLTGRMVHATTIRTQHHSTIKPLFGQQCDLRPTGRGTFLLEAQPKNVRSVVNRLQNGISAVGPKVAVEFRSGERTGAVHLR